LTAPATKPLTARTATATATGQITAKALLALTGIASTAVITRALGVGGYANWALALSLVAIVGFALEPGFAPVIGRRIWQRDAPVPRPASLLAYRLALAAVVYVAVALAALAIRGVDAMLLALVLAAELYPRSVTLNAGTWLQAYHRLHRQAWLEVAAAALGLAALLALSAAGASAYLLAAAGVTLPAALLAALSWRQLRTVPQEESSGGQSQREIVRSLIREVAPLAVAILLVSVYTRIDVVFVAAAEDAAGLAQYLLAFRFVEQLIVVAGILAQTLMPMIAARVSTTRAAFEDELTHRMLVALAVFGTLGAEALIVAAKPLIAIVGGHSFAFAAKLLILLAPMATALVLNFFLAYLLMAIKLGGRYLRYNAIALAFNLAANAVFTLKYGNVAAARVTWATEFLVVGAAMLPLAAAHAGGRAAALRCALLVAVTIASSELAYAHTAAPLVVGALGALGAVAIGGRTLWIVSRP
jgi:O-antigen/teichoic acid export membrane protein